ncbi:MAG TPA: pantoate--beta-alanine ligase [Steroidobacteraceae bacterium]|nr:pantoate--beta-alanine ligase [Steroidobacteraceae bacterium]
MQVVNRIVTLREQVRGWRRENLRVALVPTMGNLHKGHISLVAHAQDHADRVVVSIFVNPLQFGPTEDYEDYPRTLEHDKELLSKVNADLVFAPPVYEIYPVGHERTTTVEVADLSGILCGAFRPGHFTGVATVVTKLLNIVLPDVAVFGEKDYQQLIVIRRLVADLCLPVDILGGPTVRDHDGLALSSRNKYLNVRERSVAPKLYESLKLAKQRIEKGENDFESIQQGGMRLLERAGLQPDYFAIRQAADLAPLRTESRDLIVLAAARLGKARLIDNVHARVIEHH